MQKRSGVAMPGARWPCPTRSRASMAGPGARPRPRRGATPFGNASSTVRTRTSWSAFPPTAINSQPLGQAFLARESKLWIVVALVAIGFLRGVALSHHQLAMGRGRRVSDNVFGQRLHVIRAHARFCHTPRCRSDIKPRIPLLCDRRFRQWWYHVFNNYPWSILHHRPSNEIREYSIRDGHNYFFALNRHSHFQAAHWDVHTMLRGAPARGLRFRCAVPFAFPTKQVRHQTVILRNIGKRKLKSADCFERLQTARWTENFAQDDCVAQHLLRREPGHET